MAQLEKRVHANGVAPVRQALIRLELPLGAVFLYSLGDLGLWVPSVIEPQERNLLINPAHPQYASIAVVTEIFDFAFDP